MSQRSLIAILVLCIACSGLSGCASKFGEQTVVVKYYPDCYTPIQKLREDERRVTNTAVSAALAAAATTALITGLITRDVTRTVVAAGTAAIAAGYAGYYTAVLKKERDENARMARYLQDLNGDISNLNIVTASARMAIQCYEGQFDILIARYKEEAISREQLDESYKEISSGLDEAQRILGKVIDSARKGEEQYQAAINEEEKRRTPIVQQQPQQQPQQQAQRQPQQQPKQQPKQQAKRQPQQPQTPPPAPGSLDEVKATQASYQASIEDASKANQEADDFRERMRAHMS